MPECNNEWWTERSLPVKILMVIGFIAAGFAFLAFFGWVVMALWNALMPEIFGLKAITYWQAWGLLILSTLLFKGMRHGGESGRRSERKRKRYLRNHLRDDEDSVPEDGEPEASL